MIEPAVPHNESARLKALLDYNVLDSETERSFDELTELVSAVLDVPIALVSLIDQKRQWFKSHHGLDATETPREIAFCAHAILDEEVFVVEDSHEDERFCDNPLVTDAPHVRFYAGAPLITPEGYKIGTLCGIDHQPHVLSPKQRRLLQIIAHQVVALLELRKYVATQNRLLQEQSQLLARSEAVNREIQDLVSVISHDLRAPVLNLVGFSNEIRTGTRELDQLIRECRCKLPETAYNRFIEIIEDDLIDSLDHMERSGRQIQDRIDAIVTLSKHGCCDSQVEDINLDELVRDVLESHSSVLNQLAARIDFDRLPTIRTKKIPIQVIVENLVANAIKYRSPDRDPHIAISVKPGPHFFELQVVDNGRGIASDDISKIFMMFRRAGKQDTEGDGSGLAYCRAIVNRMGGSISCESEFGRGSTFSVRLPTVGRDDASGEIASQAG